MSDLKFGWMVQCDHPGCEETLVRWSEGDGPPPLPYPSDDLGGWFFRAFGYRDDPTNPWGNRSYHYRTYCPEHAAPAFQWDEDLKVWQKRRWEIGRAKHQTLVTTLGNIAKRLMGTKVGTAVEEWMGSNPRPIPPWKTA